MSKYKANQRTFLRPNPFGRILASIFAAFLAFAVSDRATGQGDFSPFPGGIDLGRFGDTSSEPVTFSTEYQLSTPTTGQLRVTAELGTSWHIYSVTQKPGGPLKTKIQIASPASVAIASAFTPDAPPKSSISKDYGGLTVEEHEDIVTWTAAIKVPAGFDGEITVDVAGLVCENVNGKCVPTNETLVAKRVGDAPASIVAADEPKAETKNAAPKQAEVKKEVIKPFREKDYHVDWYASNLSQLKPGSRGVLQFTAKPDKPFHVYEAATNDDLSKTNFGIVEKGGLLIGAPQTEKPTISKVVIPGEPPTKHHDGDVTWYLPFQVPSDAKTGPRKIEGFIAYQACNDSACFQPQALKFSAVVNVGDKATKEASPMTLASARVPDALDAAASEWVDKVEPVKFEKSDDKNVVAPVQEKSMGFPAMLLFAFLGGIILNVMPCVLPVVGIKIMSFVQQAGEDRKRVFMLNLVYVAGILSVFALLAGLAAGFSMSWGEHFQSWGIRYGLTLLLFALALSYLGVWEIPAPGMAGGKGSNNLQSKEGFIGAFFKGVFATILSTPCSGPLLGGVLGLTIGLQPIQTVAVIMTVGIGMSFPYIIIGAKPSLMSWMPKPGDWMETLKEFMAFLFLGTVAFFFNQFSDDYKLFVFVSLIAVWFGCWIIGKGPSWESIQVRAKYLLGGTAAAVVIILLSLKFLGPAKIIVPFEPYNPTRLAELQKDGRTVMVDFTADWCVNCKVNYKVAINTESTREVLEELGAVSMLADWTDHNETIKQKLTELQSRSIPLLVIYPGSDPDNPIILRDLVSQSSVLDALKKAGPSTEANPDDTPAVTDDAPPTVTDNTNVPSASQVNAASTHQKPNRLNHLQTAG